MPVTQLVAFLVAETKALGCLQSHADQLFVHITAALNLRNLDSGSLQAFPGTVLDFSAQFGDLRHDRQPRRLFLDNIDRQLRCFARRKQKRMQIFIRSLEVARVDQQVVTGQCFLQRQVNRIVRECLEIQLKAKLWSPAEC
ncbi:hypothetical protein D3C76_1421050 [compost metagenome]